ncbi:hypothetical protein [Gelidibacter mesophilus]|uniref:hypothetical protein n=1 Tax=Gelidibacter mesophilus TaxID=169050 RepID=UPI0004041D14|nr:hypothetical protein [Gelidibacter mesophilus]
MFALKGVIFSFFGWLVLLGSTDLATTPIPDYVPVDSVIAADDHDTNPLFFDAVFDVNHASTYESPAVKTFPQPYKEAKNLVAPIYYQLSYYIIGQQIVVNLSTKEIIFPFHCFT